MQPHYEKQAATEVLWFNPTEEIKEGGVALPKVLLGLSYFMIYF